MTKIVENGAPPRAKSWLDGVEVSAPWHYSVVIVGAGIVLTLLVIWYAHAIGTSVLEEQNAVLRRKNADLERVITIYQTVGGPASPGSHHPAECVTDGHTKVCGYNHLLHDALEKAAALYDSRVGVRDIHIPGECTGNPMRPCGAKGHTGTAGEEGLHENAGPTGATNPPEGWSSGRGPNGRPGPNGRKGPNGRTTSDETRKARAVQLMREFAENYLDLFPEIDKVNMEAVLKWLKRINGDPLTEAQTR